AGEPALYGSAQDRSLDRRGRACTGARRRRDAGAPWHHRRSGGHAAQSEGPHQLGQGRPQRSLPLRLRQEIQALPRAVWLAPDDGKRTTGGGIDHPPAVAGFLLSTYCQAPKRLSKPPEGMVGAAPLSTFAVLVAGGALVSCFDGEALGAASAVFVAGCGSDLDRATAVALELGP